MSKRSSMYAAACLSLALTACAQEPNPVSEAGEVYFQLAETPETVRCLVVDTTAAGQTSTWTFTIEGDGTLISHGSIVPTGSVTFVARAYDEACPENGSVPKSVATWLSDPVTKTILAGHDYQVYLVLSPASADVNTGVKFQVPVLKLALGELSTYALLEDGTVWSWGDNSNLKMAKSDPTKPNMKPTKIDALSNIVDIAAGRAHACALDKTGTMYCWGLGSSGQLGNGDTSSRSVPTKVVFEPVQKPNQIFAGAVATCASFSSGTMSCWGGTEGTSSPIIVKKPVPAFADPEGAFVSVAIGGSQICVGRAMGVARCWPINSQNMGVPADPGAMPIFLSTDVFGTAVVDVGIDTTPSVRSVARADGAVYSYSATSTPTNPVTAANGVVQASFGEKFGCGVRTNGTLRCWGANKHGQLGNGTGEDAASSVAVTGINNAISVTAGTNHACAIVDDGGVYCWGRGRLYALGQGMNDQASHFVPVRVGL